MNVALQPVRRQSLTGMVAEQLVRLTRDSLAPGDKLPPERELCATLAVGRSSLREALRALEIMGVVHTRNGEGTFVADADAPMMQRPLRWGVLDQGKTLPEVVEARAVLEPALVPLVAARISDAQVERLHACVRDMARAGKQHKTDFIAADLDFHMTFAAAADNAALREVMHITHHILCRKRVRGLRTAAEARKSVRLHRHVAAAAERRCVRALARAVHAHMEWMKALFLDPARHENAGGPGGDGIEPKRRPATRPARCRRRGSAEEQS